MSDPIKIMHIDREYRLVLFVIMDGCTIKSRVPLEKGVAMLKQDHFDLIVSEPHQRAFLDPRWSNRRVLPGAPEDGLEKWLNVGRTEEKTAAVIRELGAVSGEGQAAAGKVCTAYPESRVAGFIKRGGV